MSSLATAPPPAKPCPPRVVTIPVPAPTIAGQPRPDDTPATMARELALRAVARYEDARRFHARALTSARSVGGPAWVRLARQSRRDLDDVEASLAYVIEDLFNGLAPAGVAVTLAEEVERERTASGADRFIRRGFIVGNRAYILSADVGNMTTGIIMRAPADWAVRCDC